MHRRKENANLMNVGEYRRSVENPHHLRYVTYTLELVFSDQSFCTKNA